MTDNTLHILLVDDDSTDRELFIDAINFSSKKFSVSEVSNGKEALDYLLSDKKAPQLIILDLNMPIMDGRETLLEIKKHNNLKTIPVCIMSTSNARFDVETAYSSGASLYLTKPNDFKELIEMLTSLLTLFGKYVTVV